MKRLQAYLLSILFLLTGSGLSIDLSKCCGSLSGMSISFAGAKQDNGSDCCAKIKPIKTKSCCTEQRIETVINTIPASQASAIVLKLKANQSLSLPSDFLVFNDYAADAAIVKASQYRSKQLPIPILIRKRVLQI
ncbi:MAG: hypothetical protein RLZZ318_1606 [Bacteroidota bacterium]